MGTYNHKKVLSDYANDNITAEMAVGHSLQHIGKLYEAQAAANLSRYELRGRVDALEKMTNSLQTELARLTARVEQILSGRKKKSSDE